MASAYEPGEVTWVEVPGGRLAVEVNSRDSEPVLAIHGISSQRKLWNWLRAAAPDLNLIAPDLRGRGDSVGVTLPSSIGRHAADMVLIMNNLGLEAAHVLLTAEWSTGAGSAPAYPPGPSRPSATRSTCSSRSGRYPASTTPPRS
jgi:pimeloyl-ACP methyl ester carboxylesterase